MLAVPPAILDLLELGPGAQVHIAVEDGRLVVAPNRRKRYSLDELLAQCDPTASVSPEDRAWVSSGPVGKELI